MFQPQLLEESLLLIYGVVHRQIFLYIITFHLMINRGSKPNMVQVLHAYKPAGKYTLLSEYLLTHEFRNSLSVMLLPEWEILSSGWLVSNPERECIFEDQHFQVWQLRDGSTVPVSLGRKMNSKISTLPLIHPGLVCSVNDEVALLISCLAGGKWKCRIFTFTYAGREGISQKAQGKVFFCFNNSRKG